MFNAIILIEFLDLKCIHSRSKMISVNIKYRKHILVFIQIGSNLQKYMRKKSQQYQ